MVNRFRKRFPYYPDDTDYTTNSPSYYDDLARKNKLIKLLAERIWEYEETLDLTLNEIEQRLTDYINENDDLLSERLEQWDKRIDEMPEEMESLFITWLNDGTLEQIINHDVLGNKADKDDVYPSHLLVTIKHDLGFYPSVLVMYNEYCLDTVPFEETPDGVSFDGTKSTVMNYRIEHLSKHEIAIFVTDEYLIEDYTYDATKEIIVLNKGIKSISIVLGNVNHVDLEEVTHNITNKLNNLTVSSGVI